jgi:hypothetical protein
MKFLAVHPSCLMYSKIYLRLEPLGLVLVAVAAERAGHPVQLIDLQCESHRDFFRAVQRWRPDAIAFRGNYLANVPEIIDLARARATCCRTPLFALAATASHLFPTKFCATPTVPWIAC